MPLNLTNLARGLALALAVAVLGDDERGAARGADAVDVDLEVGHGEVLALLGPSGSGKTTALRLIAGFETPDRGALRIDGEDVIPLPPERRRFGMVFQHYALFPHLTVGENVAFGLAGSGLSRAEREHRVATSLALVDLPGFAGRRVGEISGGQQQRVALARALAPEPRVLLLDEPLSNLDPSLRERTRRELRRAVERVGITTVLVTHEQDEAFHLRESRNQLLQGLLAGASLCLLLYSLAQWVGLRDPMFLHYALTLEHLENAFYRDGVGLFERNVALSRAQVRDTYFYLMRYAADSANFAPEVRSAIASMPMPTMTTGQSWVTPISRAIW